MKKSIKNLKPFILGFLVCFLLMNFSNVKAAIKEYILQEASYPITLNGETYESDKLPPLVWEGNTYVPLKAMGDLLGAEVDWNKELKRVEITTVTETADDSLLSKQVEAEAVKAVENEDDGNKLYPDDSDQYKKYTENGVNYVEYKGKNYIDAQNVRSATINTNVKFDYDYDTKIISIKNRTNNSILLSNVPYIKFEIIYIDYTYYIEKYCH
ncbi:stalk domain-containing protein [Vallitalea guaymasensis]|uniref:stalk domain-containing protein n=1 Tax=Vallitalea guaymasensis TaxID=1185412 RepID=UPI000DE46418|nr:stalk domain-containing protein [Vallitalea guaymasensis]